MAILVLLVSGCAENAKVTSNSGTVGVPLPVYPSDKVMKELDDAFGGKPYHPVWFYIHEDFKNKCAQERALGKTCKF